MWMVFWTFLTPLPPPMWIILQNKGYVLMWIFREPPLPPWSSTWFKDPPYRESPHKTVKWETENTVLCEIVLFQIENRDIAKNSTM